ncbi:MAG: hypothetical protein M0T77_13870 [Actinomycetota bacterium]|nr:hypothetical protein [Actinomycetota bacterium]
MRNKILMAAVALAGFGLVAAVPAVPAQASSPRTGTAPEKLCPAGVTNLAYCTDHCPAGVLVGAYCEPKPPIVPIIQIRSHPTRIIGGRLGVVLRCLHATCVGNVRVSTTVTVILHRGKRRLRRRRTVVIARGDYRMAPNTLRLARYFLDRIGWHLLRIARHHRLVVRIVATVEHGRTAVRTEPIFLG